MDKSYRLYTDGCCEPNPGKSGIGFVIYRGNKTICDRARYMGIGTCNTAEFHALLLGLLKAIELGIKDIDIYSDSKLLVNGIIYRWGYRKSPHLKVIIDEIRYLLENIKYTIRHVYRNSCEGNIYADYLSRVCLPNSREIYKYE